ncbi:MAG: DUF1446 domain-containing protein [Balneolaceae bacterium]|nr:MAG: DUF1446 domain-containing protein [Balneolaceae bacterium]
MKSTVRIASGQGFWGDLPLAPVNQVRKGSIDYLMMDYLAEVTMSIMQKQKMRNPAHGYARDFVEVFREILPDIREKGIKILTNAGGVNPEACKDALLEVAAGLGITGLNIAVVDGDDILDQIESLNDEGHMLHNMDDGRPVTEIRGSLLSANVYFGARPMVEALKKGADVVITGRVTDTGLCLAPMIHEFGWSFDDFDKMASGTIAGHILECGAQSSGGNFTDWHTVDDFAGIGFPIVEAFPDGSFVVTKHENTGGLVNLMTVKEQLLYEIGDPAEYITPDCVADFTSVRLEDDGVNRVRVMNIKGKPDTPFFKVSASYNDGYKMSSSLVYSWPDALKKAVLGGEILKKRAERLGLKTDEIRCEYIGFSGCSEQEITDADLNREYNEIQLRFSARGKNKDDLNRLGMEIAPLILTGPSSVTGFAGGRPRASDVVAYWPALISKKACSPRVRIFST